jgi:hypothetical protein
MLEVTSIAQEEILDIDFSEIYRHSELYQLTSLDFSCTSTTLDAQGGYIINILSFFNFQNEQRTCKGAEHTTSWF